MITFEDIKKANDSIRTTDIKGKEYAEVNQRIKAFRIVYPTGTIDTNLYSNQDGVCVFVARVGFSDENGNYTLLGTGTAFERESSSFINKTSYIENCETSAVGRALGMAGFGIDTSVASADEVQNAINNQPSPEGTKKKAKSLLQMLQDFVKQEGIDPLWISTKFGKIDLSDLNDVEINNILNHETKVLESWKKEKVK